MIITINAVKSNNNSSIKVYNKFMLIYECVCAVCTCERTCACA